MVKKIIEWSIKHPIDWMIHFAEFFILQRFSGINFEWAIILVISVEIWEATDWSPDNIFKWFLKRDTWIDIIIGLIAIYIALII